MSSSPSGTTRSAAKSHTATAGAVGSVPETEAGFLEAVIALARLRGWKCFHPRPARTAAGWRTALQGDAGWPDLVLCRPPRLIIAELKTERGRVTPEQDTWLQALALVPDVHVFVFRPHDWPAIEAILQ